MKGTVCSFGLVLHCIEADLGDLGNAFADVVVVEEEEDILIERHENDCKGKNTKMNEK